MREIRLGTIGSGVIVHSILDGVQATEGIRLAAVYSRSEERGRALASQYGASKVYTDMEEFLGDEEINFVYVASPNLLHYEQAKRALLAGKNVICEKPFCTRTDHARELAKIAREKRLFLVDAVPPSFLPNFEIIRRELPKIGNVKLVMSNFSQYSSRYDLLLKGEVPNIFNPRYAGGCLMDINFYNVYLNVALFGKPGQAVYYPNLYKLPGGPESGAVGNNLAESGAGRSDTLGSGTLEIDTSGIMVMKYDGFVCQASGAKDTWGVNFAQIEGDQGYIYIKDGFCDVSEVTVVTKNSRETFCEQAPGVPRWTYEIQNLTKLLLADDYGEIDRRLDVMLDVMEVLETSRKAAGILFPGDEGWKK